MKIKHLYRYAEHVRDRKKAEAAEAPRSTAMTPTRAPASRAEGPARHRKGSRP